MLSQSTVASGEGNKYIGFVYVLHVRSVERSGRAEGSGIDNRTKRIMPSSMVGVCPYVLSQAHQRYLNVWMPEYNRETRVAGAK